MLRFHLILLDFPLELFCFLSEFILDLLNLNVQFLYIKSHECFFNQIFFILVLADLWANIQKTLGIHLHKIVLSFFQFVISLSQWLIFLIQRRILLSQGFYLSLMTLDSSIENLELLVRDLSKETTTSILDDWSRDRCLHVALLDDVFIMTSNKVKFINTIF